jgi:trehalose/maltose hydrolase-like predicted phosphorylase
VIGVDRGGQSRALREAGADVVVSNLAQVHVAADPPSEWSLVYEGFDPAREAIREALCALGNGYFTVRGTAAWAHADGVHYPGTYLGGGYNRLTTEIAGRVVENEDLVNLPNWLALEFRIADEDWFGAKAVEILSYRQELDLRRGLLLRMIRFEDGHGRRSTLTERRFVSMADMHLGALELALTAENWSAQSPCDPESMDASSTRVRSSIDRSTTGTWSRSPARSSDRTVCISGCAPRSHICTSRRQPAREPSAATSSSQRRVGSWSNRDTSVRSSA